LANSFGKLTNSFGELANSSGELAKIPAKSAKLSRHPIDPCLAKPLIELANTLAGISGEGRTGFAK
jgi:hypothetical protein